MSEWWMHSPALPPAMSYLLIMREDGLVRRLDVDVHTARCDYAHHQYSTGMDSFKALFGADVRIGTRVPI